MVSVRSSRLPPFYVMEILEKAHDLELEGADIIHLEIGEPDLPTPPPIIEATYEALQQGKTQYTHSLGVPHLRQAISRHYAAFYGVEVSPDNILVTSGTSPAMLILFATLLDPGEQIILSNPSYACYPNIIEFVEGVPRYVEVYEEDGFNYRPRRIMDQLDEGVKGIIMNSPSNPTGIVMTAEEMEAIVDVAAGHAHIISDEIYHGLVYRGKEHSILEFTDRCFVLNGFSKLYSMTGWRLGYVIAPPEFLRPMQKIQQNLLICANSFVQWAAIAALERTGEFVAEAVKTYDRRRRFMLERVRQLGFGVSVEPTGAFYIFANAKAFTDSAYDFCLDILEKAHVAITPGIDFGSGGEGYVRFSYANSLENIAEGMDRVESYLKERG